MYRRSVKKGARHKVGLSPGKLVYHGKKQDEAVVVDVFDYSAKKFSEITISELADLEKFKTENTVSWINISGIHNLDMVRDVSEIFQIHNLVQEDIVNNHHRPKIEESEDVLFFVVKMLTFDPADQKMHREQVSMILGNHFLLTYQEEVGDVFEPVRQRLRSAKGRIRSMRSDYLAYCLIDVIVDNYFVSIEAIEDQIELIDAEILEDPQQSTHQKIHNLKTEIAIFRKSVLPLKEIVNTLLKSEFELIHSGLKPFLKDLQDHLLQAIESIDHAKDNLKGLSELYMSVVSNRLNETMKVLTIMASIFIPLTFIVGVYGMNFKLIPELQWDYGYLYVWLLMVAIGAGLVVYFKKKNWF